MRSSYHYNLNLVEGSDLVNPLVQDVPNYEAIDNQMYDNAVASIGLATELKSGTVHALTRSNPDAPMFRFVATSRYDEGDTFTVDGIQVSGLLSDGTTLSDGAYAINANVLCCLVGSVLTLYTVPGAIQTAQNALKLGGELPAFYGKASDVQTALTTANAAGLLANNVNNEITNYDFSQTSLEDTTTFKSMIQQILNKVFPKKYSFVEGGIIKNLAMSSGNGALTEVVGAARFTYTGTGTGPTVVSTTVDLTNYSKLIINARVDRVVDNTNEFRFGINGDSSLQWSRTNLGANTNLYHEIDISNVNGTRTIMVFQYDVTVTDIYDLWAE